MDMLNSLRRLTTAVGVSGDEIKAAAVAKELLSAYTDDIRTDALGSVIGTIGTTGPKIMLEAHLDQIGLIVTAVDEQTGFVRFDRCGGTDRRVLAAERVTIHGEKDIPAVVISTPPHLLDKADENKALPFDKLAADTGLTPEEAKKYIHAGDRITVNPRFETLLNDRVCASFSDDRAGVLAVLRALDILKETDHGCQLIAVFASQEETGGSGAKTAAFGVQAEEAIAVDVSFAKAPDVSGVYADLGKGTMICFAPGLSKEMSNTLVSLAKENNIAFQVEVAGRSTGTDADDIAVSRAGVKTALLSLPQRNMHTAAEIIDMKDIEATAQLMAAYVKMRGGRTDA